MNRMPRNQAICCLIHHAQAMLTHAILQDEEARRATLRGLVILDSRPIEVTCDIETLGLTQYQIDEYRRQSVDQTSING